MKASVLVTSSLVSGPNLLQGNRMEGRLGQLESGSLGVGFA